MMLMTVYLRFTQRSSEPDQDDARDGETAKHFLRASPPKRTQFKSASHWNVFSELSARLVHPSFGTK